MVRLAVKYCGGCNPLINRKQVLERVVDRLKQQVPVEICTGEADVLLVMGGCPVCCVDLDEKTGTAVKTVIVGGCLVDYLQVEPAQLVETVARRILGKEEGASC